MNRAMIVVALGWICAALALSAAAAESTVSLESLLNEAIDRDALPRLPSPTYVLKQASSYDRKQTDPKDLKTWFANDDHHQFIRKEKNQGRNEWVIMEHQGPGAVVRFWTPLWPNLDKATIRFYLDGQAEPALQANFNELMSGRLIELRVPAIDNDPKRLFVALTKSYDYGILRFTINGQKVPKDIDTFAPKPVLADLVDLGVFTPKDKQFTLRVEVIGTNPSSRGPKYYFGMDCIKAVKP